MNKSSGLTVRVGDTYLSPTWAVVIDGAGVDLTDGWTVRAQARERGGEVVLDWDSSDDGEVLVGSAAVEVGGETYTTSTVRLYLSPTGTSALAGRGVLLFDIEIEHPTYGPLEDLYRVTLVSDSLTVADEVTRTSS